MEKNMINEEMQVAKALEILMKTSTKMIKDVATKYADLDMPTISAKITVATSAAQEFKKNKVEESR